MITCELDVAYSLILVLTCSLFKNKVYRAVRKVKDENKPLFFFTFCPPEQAA